jgi:hypothetical protein
LTKIVPSAFWPVEKVPHMSTMNCDTHMPIAPQKRRGRRPHLSMAYIPGMVEATFIADVIMEMTKPLEIPEF